MTPYATLLTVRRIEEQQAEVVLAEALREVTAVGDVLARLRRARQAWLGAPQDPSALAGLEQAERHAETRLAEAERRAEAARQALLERQRQRKLVERLHLDALAAAARAEARREQAVLDEIGGRALSGARE